MNAATRSSVILTVTLLSLSLAMAASPAEGKCRYAPATSVCLDLPKGFKVSDTFSGFENRVQNTEVHVSELDQPYQDVVADITLGKLENQGMEVMFARKEVLGKGPAIRIKIRDDENSPPLFRQVLIVGYPQKTVLVNMVYPQTMETTFLTERLEAMMDSLQYHPQHQPELARNLAYQIQPEEGLSLTRRIRNSLIYTRAGQFPNTNVSDPVFITGYSAMVGSIQDPLEFAIQRVHQLPNMTEILVNQVEEITIDELQGYEIQGQARDQESYARLALYQVMLFNGEDGYYLMVGTVGDKEKAAYLKKFRAMARSFRRDQ